MYQLKNNTQGKYGQVSFSSLRAMHSDHLQYPHLSFKLEGEKLFELSTISDNLII